MGGMCIYGKIFIALCAVGTIAVGGFLAYKKVTKKKKSAEKDDIEKENKGNDESDDDKDNKN